MKKINSLIWIAVIVAGIIVFILVSNVRADRNLKEWVKSSFGKPPVKTDYSLDSIETYYCYKTANSRNDFAVDDITWDDLDMDEVFRRINVCLTSVGEEYLYNCLHEPKFDDSELPARESFISRLEKQLEERLKLQFYLGKIGKSNYNGISGLIYKSGENLLKYPFVYKILSQIPLISVALMFANIAVGTICLIVSFAVNTAVYLATKRKMEIALPAVKYFSSMLWWCNKLCKIENLKTEPVFIRLNRSFSVFKPLIRKSSGIGQKIPGEMGGIYEFVNILRLSEIKDYNKVISGIIKHTEEFHDLYKTVGEIDSAICILSFRESLPFYSKPEFHSENRIKFTDVCHPLLSSPVPNSGEVRNNSIVTGSNASGKSTFIKTLAVNGILAQTIYTCTAKNFLTKHYLVITSMAVRDDLSKGESYFITEIKSLKRILNKIRAVPCACYIDEILRGTNTVERIAASASVLKYLNGQNCLCMAASHDIELAHIMENTYDNYNFCEQVTESGLIFDYKLKNGITQTRNAIKLLWHMKFDSVIVEDAEALAAGFESSQTWTWMKF